MRILALPKNLEVGGSQVNAVDLSVSLHSIGHNVLVASPDGPLGTKLAANGVETGALPRRELPIGRIRAMTGLIRAWQPDVIHAYEVRGIVDACYSSRLANGPPVLGTILSTRVPWYLPESVPITVGMPRLFDFTRRWRTGSVALIRPPIVTSHQRTPTESPIPHVDDLGDPQHLAILVSRLVEAFKKEGILRTIASMTLLGNEGVALLIVGDGPARPVYEAAAQKTNTDVGRPVVAFSGELVDPEPAFAAADVIIGNGTSVMRAAADGKPGVVIGRQGFSTVIGPEVLEALAVDGFYGVGDGLGNPDPLAGQILAALSPDRAGELEVVKKAVLELYGVEAVAEQLDRELIKASAMKCPGWGELTQVPLRVLYYRTLRARLRFAAESRGLHAEQADNYVYGRLRNMALPPARFGTGRNLRSDS